MNISRLFCAILLAAVSVSASPLFDVTYSNGDAGNDGRFIIGLTQISLKDGDGITHTFDSMCFDFQHEIGNGQAYLGTVTKLTEYSNDPQTQALYNLAGLVYIGMHNVPYGEVLQGLQYGVWDLMDQTVSSTEALDSDIYGSYKYSAEVDAAVELARANPAATLTQLQKFPQFSQGALDNLYVVQGVDQYAGLQKFIIGGNVPGVTTTSAVPEPASMGLLGGGLLALAMGFRKRGIR